MSGLLVFAIVPADRIEPGLLAPAEGLPPGLETVVAAGFAAIVGTAPEGGLKGRDRGSLLPWLLASQKVIERLMARGPVLPAALGSVLEDESRVRHMLVCGQAALAAAFETLNGCWQTDLSVRWDLSRTVAHLMTELPPGLRAAAETGDETARRSLGAALAGLVAGERRRIQSRIGAVLGAVARDLIVSDPVEPEGVVGVALLVDAPASAQVDAALDRLDGEFEGRLTFRLVGPLAPYSFATVQIHLGPAAGLAGAHAELGLEAGAPLEAVKAAYHRLIVGLHPDLVPHGSPGDDADDAASGKGGRAARFAAVTAAYRTLQAEHAPVSLRRQDGLSPG
ncbi:GvpL/GvpF family gas vesicle protein [Aquabacter spiritensis]|uniref:Gas vesicle protein GvpL/GvpF n=1 Tax=Aquabacter spiritensis TaxID=933073 RepID=A0A4R3LRK1_9HYPH|nr:GvpL/GvpF family gas vesicle protein [Aquabacter spiritensis]TCT02269.1 gas vesicle protein GvpL/GvpF [Aquabacter spiritensis]